LNITVLTSHRPSAPKEAVPIDISVNAVTPLHSAALISESLGAEAREIFVTQEALMNQHLLGFSGI
jgi:hypothetical protein